MPIKRRRRWSHFVVVLASVLLFIVTALVANGARPEVVSQMWVSADVAGNDAQVTEVIDYDFGGRDAHGIFRTVPGLAPTADVGVASATAPDDAEVTALAGTTNIRVGDPDLTVSGQHRYEVTYPLSTLVEGSMVAWNAVGTEWEVPVQRAEIHVRSATDLEAPTCVRGSFGDITPCSIVEVEPGHLMAVVEGLEANEGVTVSAARGTPLTSLPPAPQPSVDMPERPGIDFWWPAVVASLAFLIGSVIAVKIVRRAGREKVAGGGAADAAFAEDGASYSRMDFTELGQLASVEFVPPKGLSPAEGGVLLEGRATTSHQAAWLMQAGIDGHFTVDQNGDGHPRLVKKPDAPRSHYIVEEIFGNRDEVRLGRYDRRFAAGWSAISRELQAWLGKGGLWDAGSLRRRVAVLLFAMVVAVAFVAAVIGVTTVAILDPRWLALLAVAALVAGCAVAAAVHSHELSVLTPYGSGLWIRTESFRRFLAASEAQHVEYAAERGRLREYTAWAVALGEVDRWNDALSSSAALEQVSPVDQSFLAAAPLMTASAATASTPPSQSGSGSSSGFGGGSVGGGGGGGGGGSW